jgi:CHASE1-domain containing sensor protein
MGDIKVQPKDIVRQVKIFGRTYEVKFTPEQFDRLSKGLKVLAVISVVGIGATGVVLYKKKDEVKAKVEGWKGKIKEKIEAKKRGY